MLAELKNKLAHLFRRQRFDDSLDEEMQLHVEYRADELIASGIAPGQAHAQARREFGSAARVAEDSRDAWRWNWLEDLHRDLRHAARGLARDKGFAATAVISLAIGIGVNTTMFSLTAEFLFSQPSVRDPDTLVSVTVGGNNQIPGREYRFLRDAKVFSGLVGTNPMQEVNWRNGDSSLRLFVTRVTDNYFHVTGVPVALGRGIGINERNVVVLTHRFWQSRLSADPKVLGRSLTLDGQPHTVIGVLASGHRTLTGFGYAPDIYLPQISESSRLALYGRLPSGGSAGATAGRLRAAAAQMDQIYPDGPHKWADNVFVLNLVGIERLTFGFLTSIAAFFALLMAVVGLLLLIACANVASLLLARASARAQEFAIRMSIGAGRGRLIRQLLTESLLLAALGTIAGLTLTYLLTRALNSASLPFPFPMRLAIEPDSRLLTYAVMVAIATAIIAGLLPALKSTRSGTSALLKSGEHQVSGRRTGARNTLVAGQLAISVLVLVIATLSIRNLIKSATLDPGFDLKRTVWAEMRLVPEGYPNTESVRALVASALDRVRGVAGVNSATVAVFVPLNDHFASRNLKVYTDASPDGLRMEHSWNAVGPDYLTTMGIDLVAGREFGMLDREGSQRVLIVNEAFAKRAFGETNPLGRRVRFSRDDRVERTIVGVARNSKYSTIGERDRPAVYEPWFQAGGGRPTINLLIRSNGSPDTVLKPVTTTLLNIDPAAWAEAKPMRQATGFALLPSRMGAFVLGTIGVLGLVLASVGLYGVLAWSISRRTREIGLRMALGAQRGDILSFVLREGVWILSTGMAAGLFFGLLVTQPLVRFLVPGLSASDPLSYASVALILVMVGLAASVRPALRALRISPLDALRYE